MKEDVDDKRKKRYNKRHTYNEFNTIAMQWAYSADTQVGDIKYIYHPRRGNFVWIEATKSNEGYVLIDNVTSSERAEINNDVSKYKRRADNENASVRTSDNRRGYSDNNSFFENRTGKVGNDRVFETESETDPEGSLERNGENNKEISTDLKHSLGIKELKKENKSLIRQNREFERMIGDLERQLRNGGYTHSVDYERTKGIARRLKKNYLSKIDTTVLSDKLYDFFNMVANNKELSWDVVQTNITDIAENILDEPKYKNPDISEYSKGVLSEIKSVGIKLNDVQKEEVAHRYGSYNDFRKMTFGAIKIRNDGIDLDSRWAELSQMYPNLFDENVSDADQAVLLWETIQALRNHTAMIIVFSQLIYTTKAQTGQLCNFTLFLHALFMACFLSCLFLGASFNGFQNSPFVYFCCFISHLCRYLYSAGVNFPLSLSSAQPVLLKPTEALCFSFCFVPPFALRRFACKAGFFIFGSPPWHYFLVRK